MEMSGFSQCTRGRALSSSVREDGQGTLSPSEAHAGKLTPRSRPLAQRRSRYSTRLALGAMSLLLALPELVAAQSSVTIPSEYDKVASLRTTVTALGPDLFGDEVSLYDGTVQFRQVDVSLPGNDNLPVEIARRFTPRQWPSSKKLSVTGSWIFRTSKASSPTGGS